MKKEKEINRPARFTVLEKELLNLMSKHGIESLVSCFRERDGTLHFKAIRARLDLLAFTEKMGARHFQKQSDSNTVYEEK